MHAITFVITVNLVYPDTRLTTLGMLTVFVHRLVGGIFRIMGLCCRLSAKTCHADQILYRYPVHQFSMPSQELMISLHRFHGTPFATSRSRDQQLARRSMGVPSGCPDRTAWPIQPRTSLIGTTRPAPAVAFPDSSTACGPVSLL